MLVEKVSDYRQDWFGFRVFANIEWVKEQIEGYEIINFTKKNKFFSKTSFFIFFATAII